MDELAGARALLNAVIERMRQGAGDAEIRQELGAMLRNVAPTAFDQASAELSRAGVSPSEAQSLRSLHQALFRESSQGTSPIAPPGHPVHILMEEHNAILRRAIQLRDRSGDLNAIVADLKSSAAHYVREENVLFPYLEKHGISGPTAAMWTEHDRVRELEKGLYHTLEARDDLPAAEFDAEVAQLARALAELLTTHFHKENSVLFPASLRVITKAEWFDARQQFDELGYCTFTPASATVPMPGMRASAQAKPSEAGMINLPTGAFSALELERIMNALPVDITFVDKDDRVRYFSESPERIFPRTKAVIGRSVERCHPEKSVYVVTKILDDFRAGKRDQAEFWINLGGRLIHIRYFAVRDGSGAYLGCAEVSQDITDIQKITGEKRLL